jgi:hypothetical protein
MHIVNLGFILLFDYVTTSNLVLQNTHFIQKLTSKSDCARVMSGATPPSRPIAMLSQE